MIRKALRSKEIVAKYTKRYKRNGKLRRVFLRCTKCGRKRKIAANDKTIYTKEFRKTFVCIFCQP